MPLVHILASIANIEFRKGNLEAVKQINQRRLRILGDVFPGDHGLKAEVATELGAELIEQKPLEAIRYLDQAIAMYERMDSRWVVLPLFHRAQVERNLHGDAAAMPILDRALNVCALKKMDHINCDELRANRAASIAHLGDGKRAIEEVETAMRVIERRGQDSENEYAAALASKSIALYVLGRQADAVAARNQAIALYETLFGKEHPETINARKNLDGVGELTR